MTINEIRRANLLFLLGEQNASDFAKHYGLDVSYLSQIKTRNRKMGDSFARRVEVALKLAVGWMDTAHPDVAEHGEDTDKPLMVSDPRKRALLGLFDGLSHQQQEEMIRWAEAKELENITLYDELSVRAEWMERRKKRSP